MGREQKAQFAEETAFLTIRYLNQSIALINFGRPNKNPLELAALEKAGVTRPRTSRSNGSFLITRCSLTETLSVLICHNTANIIIRHDFWANMRYSFEFLDE
jgi:hypothetical protein